MKNCLNFRTWLMPLVVIVLFMSNITQVDGQILIIRSSDPISDTPIVEEENQGQEVDDDPCLERDNNKMFISIRRENELENASITGLNIKVEGLSGEVQSIEDRSATSSENMYFHYEITFDHDLEYYTNNSNSTNDIEFDLSIGYVKGNNVTLSSGRLIGGTIRETIVKDLCNTCGCSIQGFRMGTAELEKEAINEVNVYPNPAKDKLTLEFDVTKTSDVSITIINSLGQKIQDVSNNISLVKGKFIKDVDLSAMAKGAYYVLVTTDEERHIQKITKI